MNQTKGVEILEFNELNVPERATTEDYEKVGDMFAIKQRLKDLLYAQPGQITTPVQIAIKGLEMFLDRDEYFASTLNRPDISIKEIVQYIKELILSTPGLNGQDSPALITDSVLNELISKMGDDFQNQLIVKLIRIGKGELEPEVPIAMVNAIFNYVHYWGYSKRDWLTAFENELDKQGREAFINNPRANSIINKFIEITSHFGHIE